MHISSVTGGDENWGFYNDTTADNLLGKDNSKSFFGTGKDASISYDGTDMVIDPDAVGSGKLAVDGDVDISGTIDVNDVSVNGVDGASATLTFGGGGSGDCNSITITNGIITGYTTVP